MRYERGVKVSVVVTVKVSEGLVLVADSAGTIEGEIKGPGVQGRGVLQIYYHAKKISHLRDYPIGTLTWESATWEPVI